MTSMWRPSALIGPFARAVLTRLQSSISLRYRAVEFESVSLPALTLILGEANKSVRGQYKRQFLDLFARSKRGNAIYKHETGDADAHRLRCRH